MEKKRPAGAVTSKREPLKLHRETLRRLESSELMEVAGGGTTVSVCGTTYQECCIQQ